jgi:hypothetical protein
MTRLCFSFQQLALFNPLFFCSRRGRVVFCVLGAVPPSASVVRLPERDGRLQRVQRVALPHHRLLLLLFIHGQPYIVQRHVSQVPQCL